MSAGPYMLVRDNDAHWFVIPVARCGHWDKWLLELSMYDDATDDVPSYAVAVGGSPGRVHFDAYEVS